MERRDITALAEAGADHLEAVIAIDSHSDERSETIPSTEGQRHLSEFLKGYFDQLGFETVIDDNANLIAKAAGTVDDAPKVAFMVHMDTARGTDAVPQLARLKGWDGGPIPYAKNDKLEVSVERYPETALYVGEDLLYGPGESPIGLDDKLGMAEMMTLAEEISRVPALVRPDVIFVCRPDEEIGRMAAIECLADTLKDLGVTHGYTIDGLAPFEVNTENFHASMAKVVIAGRPLELTPVAKTRKVTLQVSGAKSHGATAKSEGYLNATMIFTRAMAPLSRRQDVLPLSFQSDHLAETDATLTFALRGDDDAALEAAKAALLKAFEDETGPHAWKGAGVSVVEDEEADASAPFTDEGMRLFATLATFLRVEGPLPLLSEDSDGYEGYSNPCFVDVVEGGLELAYRLRDFDGDKLAGREAHIKSVCAEGPGALPVTVVRQYVNMGDALKPYPELVAWAEAAARAAGVEVLRRPIRGGTGVDPFLARGIPVANLGTGYFAPESEKEFTSVQKIGQHAHWLVHLLEQIAQHGRG
jgi:di/tripeptidase